jgi:deoxycytidine triphosphate deaminase
MANFGKVAVDLRAGVDVPAQLIFLRLSRPVRAADLYGMRKGDRFQHQTDPIPREKAKSDAEKTSAGRRKRKR